MQHLHLEHTKTEQHQHQKGQLLYAEGVLVHIFVEEKHWYLPARCFMWLPAGTTHSILTFSKHVDLFNVYYEVSQHENSFF